MKKGFTLIELLVVIAIIGILSGIVLTSLNTARSKANNSAVKANLQGIRAQAEIIYDTDSDYDAVCGANSTTQDTKVAQQLSAAGTAGGGTAVCGAPASGQANAWAAAAPLRSAEGSNTHWCVDSTGASKGITATLGATATVCP